MQSAPLHGVFLSFLLAFFSSFHHGETIFKSITEGFLCALITFGIVSSLDFFSFPQSLSPCVGACVSLLGFEKVSVMVDIQIEKAIKKLGQEKYNQIARK
ncbi:phage holin family protein [Lelliottia sp. SL45]|uniref:phage holin family protein n=1 Tax=Lelliottia sp. SL45 TaxID=2994665 RepID=UPI003FA3580E